MRVYDITLAAVFLLLVVRIVIDSIKNPSPAGTAVLSIGAILIVVLWGVTANLDGRFQ